MNTNQLCPFHSGTYGNAFKRCETMIHVFEDVYQIQIRDSGKPDLLGPEFLKHFPNLIENKEKKELRSVSFRTT